MEDIRNIYRKTTIVMVGVLFITICATYIYFIYNIGKVYEEHAVESIVEIKKDFLKSIVDNVIQEIDLIQSQEETYYEERIKATSQTLQEYYDTMPENYIDLFISFIKTSSHNEFLSVYIKAVESDEPLYASGMFLEGNPEKADFSSYFKGKYDDYDIIFGVSNEYIYRSTKNRIRGRIHSREFSQNSYIWVNEVIDYGGGENFAIRLIHPNLPETEDQYLSTKTQDIAGNYPYAQELKGINEHGEVFLKYNFKKKNSDMLSEKITYAKQYKKYDWVIGMGIHLDDIQSYIDISKKDQNNIVRKIISHTIAFMLVIFIFYWLILSKIEQGYHKKYNKKIKEAFIDPLTKAKNRRAAMTYLESSFKRFKKTGESPMVMIFDIDDFKAVNDTFGHLEGDAVLKNIVEVINNHIRGSDSLYRWGGEEFLLICNGLKEKDVFAFSNKIISIVGSKEYDFQGEKYHATISVGVDRFVASDKTYEEAIKRADSAMYKAKEQGKNRACLGDMCGINPLIKY